MSTPRARPIQPFLLALRCTIIGTIFGWLLTFAGCRNADNTKLESLDPSAGLQVSKNDLKIEQFCGNCHPLPAPSSFPKNLWPSEIARGFNFYLESGRNDLEEPLVLDTERYFQSRAPEKIEVPSAESFPVHSTTVQFVPSPLLQSGDTISLTADIEWIESTKSLFFSDMANNKLRHWSIKDDPNIINQSATDLNVLTSKNVLASGNHLCRIVPCDWNSDGILDFMVAEIGSMIISDQKLGNVAIYIGLANNSFDRRVLASELARPVEAVALDYDEDGDQDVLVAEFGYNTVGCLSLLRNQLAPNSIPTSTADFKYEVVDPRHGQLAVVLADMNNDSKTDIVTATGQEFESVQIRYNLGGGNYRNEIVMALPDPSYNTSSIHICDINRDGLQDIVHTCGDIFDSFVPKQFHGVRLIQNMGKGRWETRDLGMLIGAMQATTADFDGDGDLDVAAVGLFPGSANYSPNISYDSVCWWEQLENLDFVRHSIERDRCLHSSCTTADVDGDGRQDLVVGEWAEGTEPSSLRIYWNRSQTK